MTETIKENTGIVPELMKYSFEYVDVPYNLRNQSKYNLNISCSILCIIYNKYAIL